MMPFPGGVEADANGTLLFSAGAAFLYLFLQPRPPSWRRTVVKAGSIVLVAVLVAVTNGPWPIMVALALSAAGDALLAQEGDRAFKAGLGAFLAAHLVYVAIFLHAGDGIAAITAEPWRLAAAVVAIAAGFGLGRLLNPVLPHGLQMPVAAYIVAILMMCLAALTLPLPLAIAGAFLFLMSDALLAVETFMIRPGAPLRRWTGPAVWLLYYAAQISIAVAFILAGAG